MHADLNLLMTFVSMTAVNLSFVSNMSVELSSFRYTSRTVVTTHLLAVASRFIAIRPTGETAFIIQSQLSSGPASLADSVTPTKRRRTLTMTFSCSFYT